MNIIHDNELVTKTTLVFQNETFPLQRTRGKTHPFAQGAAWLHFIYADFRLIDRTHRQGFYKPFY